MEKSTRGYPTIFKLGNKMLQDAGHGDFDLGADFLEQAKPTGGLETPRPIRGRHASNSPAPTECYDAEGWPVLAGGRTQPQCSTPPPTRDSSNEASAESFAPLDPKPRRRKAKALNARKRLAKGLSSESASGEDEATPRGRKASAMKCLRKPAAEGANCQRQEGHPLGLTSRSILPPLLVARLLGSSHRR